MPSIADWDAAERADLAKRGVRTRRAKKDILPGIRTVEEHLRILGNGKPRLFISPKCPRLIQELETYQWGAHGKPKETQDDHAVDAVRYFLHTMAPTRGKLEVQTI